MSIFTLLGFILCGILFGAGLMFVALYEYNVRHQNDNDVLNDEIYQLEKENLHWRKEIERMHRELVRAKGGHSCRYCDPKKKNTVDRATLNRL